MQSIATDFQITVDTVSDKVRIGFPFPSPWIDLNGQDADNLVAAIQKHRASIGVPTPADAVSLPDELSPEAAKLLNRIVETMKRVPLTSPPAAP